VPSARRQPTPVGSEHEAELLLDDRLVVEPRAVIERHRDASDRLTILRNGELAEIRARAVWHLDEYPQSFATG
jgi:hypothetical protein